MKAEIHTSRANQEKGYFNFAYILELIEMYKQYMP